MFAELGYFALLLALSVTVVQAIFPLLGAEKGISNYIALAKPTAILQFLLTGLSFVCLVQCFVIDDFSVNYVANQSNSFLPIWYKVSATWGGHEGSLLLWLLMLAGWGAAVAVYSRGLPNIVLARVVGVMGIISIGFQVFVLTLSNPFERTFLLAPLDGGDLNPLLQDIGLIIHPPMLYMGYVGFSVAFAFAIAGLLGNQLDSAWARWMRPWTTIAWCFLTVGIALGSWWAYYELGWGGWWFWDPVENASFMPWLAGTALIHALAVTDKRGGFKGWTVLLALSAFSLSLLGTFLVRSGVLTSVHAFAADPGRGLYILAFLCLVVGGSLVLYSIKASKLKTFVSFSFNSKEAYVLYNNVALVCACSGVFIGTLYPLFADVLDWGKYSVGAPFFNFFFVPLTLILLAILGVGQWIYWKDHDFSGLKGRLAIVAIASFIVGLITNVLFANVINVPVILSLSLCYWVLAWGVLDIKQRLRNKPNKLLGLVTLPRSYIGMHIAHLGLLMVVLGVAVTSQYSIEQDVRLSEGESHEVGDYRFTFVRLRDVPGPNYIATQGLVRVERNGELVANLTPEKRTYRVQKMPMTEASIDGRFTRDIFVALGEPFDDGSWAVRLHYKPMVRWLWLGSLVMAIGGALAISDRRYRLRVKSAASAFNEKVVA
jgi:cytochrome c-type biogenesis protein CcmF